MAYDFKRDPDDFSWVTTEMFDEELKEILAGDNDAVGLLSIPGIYEILAEYYNNEVLTNLQRHRDALAYDEEEEAEDLKDVAAAFVKAEADNMAAGDECPNCHCGTIEETDDEFLCIGECGSIFRKEKR